jgi:hypothetical protein
MVTFLDVDLLVMTEKTEGAGRNFGWPAGILLLRSGRV